MFRTARVSTVKTLPAWKLVILAFLVSCLAMHYLGEDFGFLLNQPSLVPVTTTIDELTHQDDLALAVNLPDQILANRPLFCLGFTFPSKAHVYVPILQPPILS